MNPIEKYNRLAREVDKLIQQRERLRGNLDAAFDTLVEVAGTSSLQRAQKLVKKHRKELKEKEDQFTAEMEAFSAKWEDAVPE